jgi:hypothetical protein
MSLILSGTDGLSDVDGSAATPAIRGTDANTGMFFPAADTIAFSEGGVESMRIDSSGNVGIGTSSPTRPLDVVGAASFQDTSAERQLLIANDGTLVRLFSRNRSNNSDVAMGFYTGVTERMRITSSGNVSIGTTSSPWSSLVGLDIGGGAGIGGAFNINYVTGNLYFNGSSWVVKNTAAGSLLEVGEGGFKLKSAGSATGGTAVSLTEILTCNLNGVLALNGAVTNANGVGITFPATQNASSNANTLDDYEEGTWTPRLADASSGGNSNTSGSAGWYTKIGNQVTIYGRFDPMTTTGFTTANQLWIRDLPFTSANALGVVTGPANTDGITYAGDSPIPYFSPSSTAFRLRTNISGGGTQILVSSINSGFSWIYFVMTYQVA